MSHIYCVKCKGKTPTTTDNIKEISKTKNRRAITGLCKKCGTQKYMFVSKTEGSSIDIHSIIGKLPRPSKGFVAPGYYYLGPYNPLERQVSFNKDTGQISKIHVQPKNVLDSIAMKHGICYSVNPENKSECDREMVKSIDDVPYKDTNKIAMLARVIINKKQQLGVGLGVKETTRRYK